MAGPVSAYLLDNFLDLSIDRLPPFLDILFHELGSDLIHLPLEVVFLVTVRRKSADRVEVQLEYDVMIFNPEVG